MDAATFYDAAVIGIFCLAFFMGFQAGLAR